MTENYATTGRPMTRALQDAIDLMPDRHITIAALRNCLADDDLSRQRSLFAALLLEFQLAEAREADLMMRLEDAHRAEVEAVHDRAVAEGRFDDSEGA